MSNIERESARTNFILKLYYEKIFSQFKKSLNTKICTFSVPFK